MTTKTGGSSESSRPPRRHPATTPISEPRAKARIVVIPTRPSVHGSAWPTTLVTGSPRVAPMEMPHRPVTMFRR